MPGIHSDLSTARPPLTRRQIASFTAEVSLKAIKVSVKTLLCALLVVSPLSGQRPAGADIGIEVRQSKAILDSAIANRSAALALTQLHPDAVLSTEQSAIIRGSAAILNYFAERWQGALEVDIVRSVRGTDLCTDGAYELGTFTAYVRRANAASFTNESAGYLLRWTTDSSGTAVTAIRLTDIASPARAADVSNCRPEKLRRFSGRRVQLLVEGQFAGSFTAPNNIRDEAEQAGWTGNAGRCNLTQPAGGRPILSSSRTPLRPRVRVRLIREVYLEAAQQIGTAKGCVTAYNAARSSAVLQRLTTSQDRSLLVVAGYRSFFLGAGVGTVKASYSAREDSMTTDGFLYPQARLEYATSKTAPAIVGQAGYTLAITSRWIVSFDWRIRRGAALKAGAPLRAFTPPKLKLDTATFGISVGAAF
jgi:hypothetical protein